MMPVIIPAMKIARLVGLAAQAELITQACGATPARLGRSAVIRAVKANFAMPLRAAAIDARVTARFRPD